MITKFVFKTRDIIIIFLILAIIVVLLQFNLLDLALKIGFKPDDWALYFKYRTLGETPLFNISEVWRERGIYTTYYIYYIGILENIVGFDYRLFQTIHIIFKSLATITVFPVVLIIFKDKLLAILTTIFFAFSAASVGSLEFVVKGSDYLAIFLMNIFLIVYYFIVKRFPRNFPVLFIGVVLLILTITSSPIRLYPLLILLILTEVYLLAKNRSLDSFKNMLIRITAFFLPVIVIILYAPDSIRGLLQSPLGILKRIVEGNWHLILSPFSGFGHTLITTGQWGRIFGLLTVNNPEEYVYFLLGGPTVVFGILTLIIAIIISKKPLLFFLFTFCSNFILEIFLFFIITHYKTLPNGQSLPYDLNEAYYALVGIYVLVLGFVCFIEWLKKDVGDDTLLALWLGPLFSFIFILATWAFAPFGTGFSGTSYYLVVAAIGSSLFLAAFLFSAYLRIIHIKETLLRIVLLFLILLILISICVMNDKEIRARFLDLLTNGRAAQGQQLLQGRFKDHIKDIDFTKPVLFYLDASNIHGDGPFYSEGFLGSFPFWMHFQNNKLIDGCLEIFYEDRKKLASLIEVRNGEKGFVYRSLCVENGKSFYEEAFYKPENFYAFKIQNRDFIDIRKKLLKELGF